MILFNYFHFCLSKFVISGDIVPVWTLDISAWHFCTPKVKNTLFGLFVLLFLLFSVFSRFYPFCSANCQLSCITLSPLSSGSDVCSISCFNPYSLNNWLNNRINFACGIWRQLVAMVLVVVVIIIAAIFRCHHFRTMTSFCLFQYTKV